MHFYPLHTTSKVSFLGFWVWFCSAVAARGPGSLMAPYPESQGARHTLALSFAVSTSFNLPLPARGSEGSIYHIPKQKNTGREDSPPLHSGDFHTTTTPVDTVKTNKSAEDQGWLLDNSSTGGESSELIPKYKPVSTASLELLAPSHSSTTNQKSSVEDTR